MGYSPWGHERVRPNLVTKQQQKKDWEKKIPKCTFCINIFIKILKCIKQSRVTKSRPMLAWGQDWESKERKEGLPGIHRNL